MRRLFPVFFRLLGLVALLWTWAAQAQELPPPGGWPLRPVAELRAVPEPPGGLVPYRQGQLWGFADTTGRVWIRPVFTDEPPRFGAGLLLQTKQAPAPGLSLGKHRRLSPRLKPLRWVDNGNLRYGVLYMQENNGPLAWTTSFVKPRKTGAAFLLNAHGEQLLASPHEAIVATANGGWQAANRTTAAAARRRELVALETREEGPYPYPQRPGQLFTTPLAPRSGAARRLTRRAYDPDVNFITVPYSGSSRYAARKVNWLHPHRRGLATRDGVSHQVKHTRYRHQGQFALFDARARRLTDYRYGGLKPLLPNRLAYWHWTSDLFGDEYAADSSGLPERWVIIENTNGPARRYGLLDWQGRELTPALYARLEVVGPNSLWVVAVRAGRLEYGLLDTLGRYLRPLSPAPISRPDAAGLLRSRSSAPLAVVENSQTHQPEFRYPDTTTVQYLHPNGQPAFAGRFRRADAFWLGRAVVQQHALYGLIDTLGRWVLPPQPEELSYFAYTSAHHDQREATDPLGLFDHFSHGLRWGPYWGAEPGDSLLLLTHGPQGYGLRSARTGRVLAPAVFDDRPQPWPGAVVGERQGQAWGISHQGQPFDPRQPTTFPPGVQALPSATPRPRLQRTEEGWRTRGGRVLWQD